MAQTISKEESYVRRRQLFKDIWAAATSINKKQVERKDPNVIKTARLDERSQSKDEKKKKQRLKHLTIVCNKLLKGRKDDNNILYEQMASKKCKSSMRKKRRMTHRSKLSRIRKANRRAKSMSLGQDASQTGITSLDLDSSLSNFLSFKVHEMALGVSKKIIKRDIRKTLGHFSGGYKSPSESSTKYPNRNLLPINKIYIS